MKVPLTEPDCKAYIVRQFERWIRRKRISSPTAQQALLFYRDIDDRDSQVKEYHCGENLDWQQVHGWIRSAGLLDDQ